MGGMTSRSTPSGGALAPEPVDAPPPTQPVQGLSFKDAVLEAPGSKPASSPRTKAAANKSTLLTSTPAQQPEGAPRAKRVVAEGDEGKGVVAAVAETTEAAARTTVAATGLWRPFRFLARTGQKGVNKFTHSQRFLNAVRLRASPLAAASGGVCRRPRCRGVSALCLTFCVASTGGGHFQGMRHRRQRCDARARSSPPHPPLRAVRR